MKLIFFGTPDFGVPCLEALCERHEVLAVVTQPDRRGDRGHVAEPPVKTAAKARGIPVLQFERVRDHLGEIAAYGAQMGVTAAYGQILTQALLDAFPRGIINVHGSLLPAYRGAAPVQWAVINGETETGITIMQTARGVDCGDVLAKTRVAIDADERADALFARLAALAPELLTETIARLERGEITPVPQDETRATRCPMLDKATGRVDWTRSAQTVYNLFRGTFPWPGATFLHGDRLCKILACRPTAGEGIPGTVLGAADALIVACGTGALAVTELRAAGGKSLTAAEYLRGHPVRVGDPLC